MSRTIHESLKDAYEDVAYVGRPNPWSHPDRLAAIGTLFGLAPPDPATARVLEVGCGDGANLLPMAAQLPGARWVGCDYSALLMGRARGAARGLGLVRAAIQGRDQRTADHHAIGIGRHRTGAVGIPDAEARHHGDAGACLQLLQPFARRGRVQAIGCARHAGETDVVQIPLRGVA